MGVVSDGTFTQEPTRPELERFFFLDAAVRDQLVAPPDDAVTSVANPPNAVNVASCRSPTTW
jgi:hypothetical protein